LPENKRVAANVLPDIVEHHIEDKDDELWAHSAAPAERWLDRTAWKNQRAAHTVRGVNQVQEGRALQELHFDAIRTRALISTQAIKDLTHFALAKSPPGTGRHAVRARCCLEK